jgi:hypothetical protein
MKRYNVYLTLQSIKALKGIAKRTGINVAELIRRAIDEFIKRN